MSRLISLLPRPVLLVAAVVALSLLGDSLLYAVLPTNVDAFGIEIGAVGVLLSVNRFVRLLSNAWAEAIYARFSRPLPFLLAALGGAATTAVYALGTSLVPLLLARVAWGMCWSLLRLGGYFATLEHALPHARGRALGAYRGLARSGSLVAVLLGGPLTDLAGPRTALLWFALANGAGALLALPDVWRLRASRGGATRRPLDPTNPVVLPQPASIASPEPGAVAPAPILLHVIALNGGVAVNQFVSTGLVAATLGFLLRTSYGAEIGVFGVTVGVATVTGVLLSGLWVAELLLGPASGHVADRRGRRVVALTGFLGTAVALIALTASPGLAVTALAALAVFAASAVLNSALDVTLADMATLHSSRRGLWGQYTTWADIGGATGPLLGYAVGVGLGLPAAYLAGVALLLGGAGLYAVAFRASPR